MNKITHFFNGLVHSCRRHPYRALVMVIILYLTLGVAYVVFPPVYEKPDENWHFAYIAYLLDHHTLPPIVAEVEINPAEQIAGHPPLYYVLASGLLKATGRANDRPDVSENLFWTTIIPGTVNDNKNHFIHPPHELTLAENRGFYLLRLFSLLIGVGTVVGAYAIVSVLGAPIELRLAAALGVALTPQYLYIASSVSNDSLLAALSAFAMFILLLAVRPGAKWHLWALFSVIVALAALTKTSALLLLGVGMMGAAFAAWRDRSWKKGAISIGGMLLALMLIAGWWYVRNAILFHDPLGTNIHHLKWGREVPFTIRQTLGEWRPIERSFWAAFGWGNVLFPHWYYVGLRMAEITALIGLGLIILRDKREGYARQLGFWLLLMLVIGGLLGLGMWTMTIQGSLGRLLFFVFASLMALMILGLDRVHRIATWMMLLWLAVMAILSPVFIIRAYLPQHREDVAEAIRDFKGVSIQFEDVARLVAYDIQPDRVWPYQQLHVTLCWEALKRTDVNYALFIQIVGQENAALGFRASHPGRGNMPTTFWMPGSVICGDYQVDIKGDAPGPAVYPVEIWMYNVDKDKRLTVNIDGASMDAAVIGYVKIYGQNDIAVPDTGTAYTFADNVILKAYHWPDVSAGEQAAISLYWQAAGQISYPYTVFLHLVDVQDNIVAQADAQPHNHLGEYPMNWWDPNEIVLDVHRMSIPKDTPPGRYTLRVGLYRLDTLTRIPLLQGGDSVDLGDMNILP